MTLPGHRSDREFARFKETPSGKTAVRVCVDDDTPVPVTFEQGDAVYNDFSGSTTPGSEQTLISTTVTTGKTRKLFAAVVVCRTEGRFIITADSAVIGSGRTGPAKPVVRFEWQPGRQFAAGVALEIKFTARPGATSSDLEAYLQASEF